MHERNWRFLQDKERSRVSNAIAGHDRSQTDQNLQLAPRVLLHIQARSDAPFSRVLTQWSANFNGRI